MYLNLSIKDCSSSYAAWIKGADFRENSGSRHLISFNVCPEDRNHLDLKTGEIFQSPPYARIYENQHKLIGGTLTIAPFTDGLPSENNTHEKSELHYFPGRVSKSGIDDDRASELMFMYYLPAQEFQLLLSSILSGCSPKSATLTFESDTFKFGWEPDGSGQQWDNEANRKVSIVGIEFKFQHVVDVTEVVENTPDPDDPNFYADAPRVAKIVVSQLKTLQRTIREFLWIFAIFGALILWKVFR
jgi:hypothetical protein